MLVQSWLEHKLSRRRSGWLGFAGVEAEACPETRRNLR
jgi:hypothetical protein